MRGAQQQDALRPRTRRTEVRADARGRSLRLRVLQAVAALAGRLASLELALASCRLAGGVARLVRIEPVPAATFQECLQPKRNVGSGTLDVCGGPTHMHVAFSAVTTPGMHVCARTPPQPLLVPAPRTGRPVTHDHDRYDE